MKMAARWLLHGVSAAAVWCLAILPASAEPILMTSGQLRTSHESPSVLQLRSADGDAVRGLVFYGIGFPCDCHPGTALNLSAVIPQGEAGYIDLIESRIGGVVTHYAEPARLVGTLHIDAGDVVLPSPESSARPTTPFEIRGNLIAYLLADTNQKDPLFSLSVQSRGIASLRFDDFDSERNLWTEPLPTYDFAPVPEPTSMILLGMPVAGLVARAVRKRRRS